MIPAEMHQSYGFLEDGQTPPELPFHKSRSISLEDAVMFSPPFSPQLRQPPPHGIRRLGRDVDSVFFLVTRVGAPAQEIPRRALGHRHSYGIRQLAKSLRLPRLIRFPLPHFFVAVDSCQHTSR